MHLAIITLQRSFPCRLSAAVLVCQGSFYAISRPGHGVQGGSISLIGGFEGNRSLVGLASRLGTAQGLGGYGKVVPPDRLAVIHCQSFLVEPDGFFPLARELLLVRNVGLDFSYCQ